MLCWLSERCTRFGNTRSCSGCVPNSALSDARTDPRAVASHEPLPADVSRPPADRLRTSLLPASRVLPDATARGFPGAHLVHPSPRTRCGFCRRHGHRPGRNCNSHCTQRSSTLRTRGNRTRTPATEMNTSDRASGRHRGRGRTANTTNATRRFVFAHQPTRDRRSDPDRSSLRISCDHGSGRTLSAPEIRLYGRA